jgi:hypothetical protein
MAATAPAKEAKSSGPALRVPPEEKFWKRYSPHGEAPLSLTGSFALHALGVGGMMLFGIYLASLFFKPTRSLPVEPVRLELPGGGGGGGKGGKGVGTNPREDVGGQPEEIVNVPGLKDGPRLPALNPVEKKQIQQKFDPASARFIQDTRTDSARAYARLDDGVRRKLSDAVNRGDAGKGGSGSGGGAGSGTGKGEGPGTGEGKATLGKREKRMLRWHMRFTANTGPEYLAQLRGLGAILAFPITEGPNPTFKIVRDLRPGGQAKDEDVSKINRIYWIDDKPQSVMDILGALRLRLPAVPSRFVAFMPEKLEADLFRMERNYVTNVLRQPFDEDKIDETNFRVVLTPNGFRPELVTVTPKQ